MSLRLTQTTLFSRHVSRLHLPSIIRRSLIRRFSHAFSPRAAATLAGGPRTLASKPSRDHHLLSARARRFHFPAARTCRYPALALRRLLGWLGHVSQSGSNR